MMACRAGSWAALVLAVVAVGSVSSLSACSGKVLVENGGNHEDGDDDGGGAGGGSVDASATGARDASGGGGADSSSDEPPYSSTPPARTCPTTGGAMVPVDDGAGGSYCMDVAEVTRASYASFLATSPDASQVPASATACAGAADFGVAVVGDCASDPDEGGLGADPVACVDWCDAVTFCSWAGKRLCGKIGGGSLDSDAYQDPGASAWFRACAAGGQRDFPYGLGFDDSACNAKGEQSGDEWAPKVAGTFTSCYDATHRIFDQSGNVEEWEDACADGQCRLRGGNYDDVMPSTLACNASLTDDIHATEPWRGFRCCAD